MRRWRPTRIRPGWPFLVLAILLPLLVQNPFLHRLLAVAALEAVLAVSLNLVLGYGGLISLGHAGFYGIGAYVTALLALHLGAPFLVTLPVAALAAAITGWIFARPILHLRGHYFAMATLALGEILVLVAYNWDAVTRGPSGLPGIPRAELFGWVATTHRDNYYLGLALLVLAIVVIRRFVDSPFGLSLIATRGDDQAAASIGTDVAGVRTMAFALAAFFAGAAGALYAHYITFVSVEPFQLTHTIALLAMVAVGGIATIPGPIVGAVLLTLLPEVLRGLADLRMVLYGILLMLVIWLRPQGLLGQGRLFAGWRGRPPASLVPRRVTAEASSEERQTQPSTREEAGA